MSAIFLRLAVMGLAAGLLAGCQESDFPKASQPVPHELVATMDKLDMKATSPIFIRIFKEESQLEVWKERRDGEFALLKTYDICRWSGELGPKKQEGDRQAPEGFYTVTPAQMNPKSNYYLSFNIGYPNAYDHALGRTGSNLMVHGACSSAGCYSMTDEEAGELFALARDAFRGGQKSFEIQALPFRMTPENLARHRDDPNMDFWRMLKVGYDNFELTHRPPKVDVCDKRYVFNADAGTAKFDASAACPPYQVPEALAVALANKQATDDQKFAAAVATLEEQAKRAAEAQQVAAAETAAKEQRAAAEVAVKKQRAAEKAASPSLLSRWFGWGGKAAATPAPPPTVVAAAPSSGTTAAVQSVPLPNVAPTAGSATAASQTAAPAAVPAASTSNAEVAPAATPQSPPVGKFVKRKFWWWLDDPTAATSDTPG